MIEPIRDLVKRHIELGGPDPDTRLFTGSKGGRLTTAALRDGKSSDDVVTELGCEPVNRHCLRHSGFDLDG